MAKSNGKNSPQQADQPREITEVIVSGYKSIANEQTIVIKPLTILAGANSSGKSSMMQPLLLVKQTLEAGYDPGILLMNGPLLKYTLAEQLLAKGSRVLGLGIAVRNRQKIITYLEWELNNKKEWSIQQTKHIGQDGESVFRPEMEHIDINKTIYAARWNVATSGGLEWSLTHYGPFLLPELVIKVEDELIAVTGTFDLAQYLEQVREIIYLPGLRGNPVRTYPISGTGRYFPGMFQNYTASVIVQWTSKEPNKLQELSQNLKQLGLAWKIDAKQIDDTQVEIRVGRLSGSKRGGAQDMVNITDVGLGISQILPVLVALLAAEPGQLVYIEQPEIHLHPRAQGALAAILAQAAQRGVRVVIETHSDLLLLGVQTLIAEGKLSPDLVALHWFERGEDGNTIITSASPDDLGAFANWPEDFGEVALEAQSRYLDAVEQRQQEKQ